MLTFTGVSVILSAIAAGAQGSRRTPFEARTASFTGSFILHAPAELVFPLFSPSGEKKWVEGWDPEILAPRGTDWAEGMIFRTASEGREDVWVVAELDQQARRVVYYRTEPGRLVARVEVRCRPLEDRRTEATVVYSYVGLSEEGNATIAAWSDAAYGAKMERWQVTITEYLRRARE